MTWKTGLLALGVATTACGGAGESDTTGGATTTSTTVATTTESTTDEPTTAGTQSAGTSTSDASTASAGESTTGTSTTPVDPTTADPSTSTTADPPSTTTADDTTTSGTSTTTGGETTTTGTTGDGACLDDIECPPGQFCSALEVCILDGTCMADLDCDGGMVCDDAGECAPGSMCGAEEFVSEPIAPNMVMVLDRSCSMTDKINGVSKWDSAVATITQLTTTYAGLLRWGLIMFPDTLAPNCGQTEYPVPLGPGTEPAIQSLLTAALDTTNKWYPDGPCVTNIDTGIQQLMTEPQLLDPDRENFVMLISDGKQAGCNAAGGDNGTTMMLDQIHGLGVVTYVVGFGSGADPAQLNIFADAGGAPLPGPTKYYQADNAAELAQAFAAIASTSISCDYQLGAAPPDWTDVFVFFDDVQSVPYDPNAAEGWDYDPATNTVTFHGAYCQQLKDLTVMDIDIVFGCDMPVPG